MADAKPLPPVEVLREHFSYDPETGVFSWIAGNGPHCRGTAGYTDSSTGYVRVGLFGKSLQVHRVIWKLMTGGEPQYSIDHINQNRADNRWANLREADDGQSRVNRTYPRGKCAHGTRLLASGRWGTNAKISLGTFDTEQEAHDAFVTWHREHYGEFSVYAV